MLVALIIYIFSFILGSIASMSNFIASGWSPWPDSILNGITYFLTNLMNWDFLLNISAMLLAIKFMISFDVIYIGVKLLLKMFNWIRGSGGIDI